MSDDLEEADTGGGAAMAREAWAILVGVSLSQRQVWLEAGQAEGLTPPQAISLMRLSPEEPRRLGELARGMHCDASYATALADRLEERGFVERRVSATDRRVRELVPTAAGLAAQKRLRAAFTTPPPGLDVLSEDDQLALMRIAECLAGHADPEVAESLGIRRRDPTATAPAGEPPVG
jgi:MarR family transcriptional regulator, organic hydroperoxide resistance regulator